MPVKGGHLTEEHRRKVRENHADVSGEKNPNYGKCHSRETCDKISEALKNPSTMTRHKMSEAAKGNTRCFGRCCSDETRDKMRLALTGKHASKETREKQSQAHLGKCHSEEWCKKTRGEKNGRWRGGVSFEPYCQKFNRGFKERVREFFNYRCVVCGKTREEVGRALAVHHVNYDKMVCCNGVKPLFVVLCQSHNAYANNDRPYWEQYFTAIINEKYGGLCY